MRFRLVVTCVVVFVAVILTTVPVALAPQNNGQANASTDNALVVHQMAAMPLAFTENRGQWDERVRFRASAGGTTLWFCRDGITYQFTHRVPRSEAAGTAPLAAGMTPDQPLDRTEPDSIETAVVHATFVGGDPNVKLVGDGQMAYRCNYFLGSDHARWRTDVPNYGAVTYHSVYPGVDVRYEGRDGILTCSFAAESESDLAQIRFRHEGNATVTETGPGQFRVGTPWGGVFEPLSDRESRESIGNTALVTASTPMAAPATSVHLAYSTYLGDQGVSYGESIAVDRSGNAYVAGWTSTGLGYEDAFVTKLNGAGNAMVYSILLGGSDFDYGFGIALDGSGNAYITGSTRSTDFPTVGPYQSDQGREDVFVSKLNAAGDALVYSTYLGGSGNDYDFGIALDANGNAYITGLTHSTDFPATDRYHTDTDSADVFVSKLNADGNALIYSTCFGGIGMDDGRSIAVDEIGNAYVTGFTSSGDFPLVDPYQTRRGRTDAFVTKLDPSGHTLVYSTCLGGSDLDYGRGIALDGSGNAYIIGETYSPDFPTVGPYQTFRGIQDAFVAKLSTTGNTLVYGTCLGGSNIDRGWGIAVDRGGNAYVSGFTFSADFPTAGSYQAFRGSAGFEDVFVTKMNPAGSALVYSTYLGGDSFDWCYGIAVDSGGNAYITGVTHSINFPTVDPIMTYQGLEDVFVAKLEWPCACHSQGDIDGSGFIDVTDVVKVIQIAFVNGLDTQDPNCPRTRGDVNNSGTVDVNDVLYIIQTAFVNGPNPVNPCGP